MATQNLPNIGQQNWGDILNRYLAVSTNEGGGLYTFDTEAQRDSYFNGSTIYRTLDEGKTCIIKTGNRIQKREGSSWITKFEGGGATTGTTTPTTGDYTGQTFYNTTDNKLYVWDGIGWKDVGGGASSTAGFHVDFPFDVSNGVNKLDMIPATTVAPGKLTVPGGKQWLITSFSPESTSYNINLSVNGAVALPSLAYVFLLKDGLNTFNGVIVDEGDDLTIGTGSGYPNVHLGFAYLEFDKNFDITVVNKYITANYTVPVNKNLVLLYGGTSNTNAHTGFIMIQITSSASGYVTTKMLRIDKPIILAAGTVIVSGSFSFFSGYLIDSL